MFHGVELGTVFDVHQEQGDPNLDATSLQVRPARHCDSRFWRATESPCLWTGVVRHVLLGVSRRRSAFLELRPVVQVLVQVRRPA